MRVIRAAGWYAVNVALGLAMLCALWVVLGLVVLACCFPEETIFLAVGGFILWEIDATRQAAIAAVDSTSHLLDFRRRTRFHSGTEPMPGQPSPL